MFPLLKLRHDGTGIRSLPHPEGEHLLKQITPFIISPSLMHHWYWLPVVHTCICLHQSLVKIGCICSWKVEQDLVTGRWWLSLEPLRVWQFPDDADKQTPTYRWRTRSPHLAPFTKPSQPAFTQTSTDTLIKECVDQHNIDQLLIDQRLHCSTVALPAATLINGFIDQQYQRTYCSTDTLINGHIGQCLHWQEIVLING